ncbi:hypothetical protein PUR23_29675 [Methylorubrum populi]|uniref:hypothetical protein n=1 Tax=Methylorubrum populi TaxID=223967 RepID=UPI0031F8CC00
MTKPRNLRKIDANLYEEDWREGDKPFKWHKMYELLRLNLNDVKIREGFEMSYKGIGSLVDEDSTSRPRYLQATGEVTNGSVFIINPVDDEPKRFTSVRLTMRPVSGESWVTFLNDRRKAGYGPGVLSHIAGDQLEYYDEKTPHLELELPIPEAIYDGIINKIELIRSFKQKSIELSADIAFFRSEVDRGLEEHYHSRDYYIERCSHNSAYFSHLVIEPEPIFAKTSEAYDDFRDEKLPETPKQTGDQVTATLLRKLSKQAGWIIALLSFIAVLMVFHR